MKTVEAGDLMVAYEEHGPADGTPAILLHGFPYDVRAYDEVARRLAENGVRSLVPYLRGYGPTRFLDDGTMRSGQQAALAVDLLAFMDAMDIPRALLAGYDWGGRAACIVAALWPERAAGLVSCGQGYNIQNIPDAWQPAPPAEEVRYWYMYYFHTRRGREGLDRNRAALCRHIWALWSPSWAFDEAAYARTAPSFDNPDFVDIVIHSYRHRFGGVEGDPRFDAIEVDLARQPDIAVPAVVLQGADDGVDPPPEQDRAGDRFTGGYRRVVEPGTGHNFPQEAPGAFADAVLSLL